MAALEAKASFFPLLVDLSDRNVRLFTTSLLLVAALLVAAVLIALVSRWRRRQEAKEDISPSAQLAQYRSLYEAGTISKDEYERLRNLLNAQMRQSLGMPMPQRKEPTVEEAKPREQPPDNPNNGIAPA